MEANTTEHHGPEAPPPPVESAAAGQNVGGGESAEGEPETAPAPAVFDSEARQRIPVVVVLDGEQYGVTLIAEPALDATLSAYAQKCQQANAAESDEDEGAGASQFSAALGAVGWLFDVLMTDVEGMGEEGEETPAGWRNIFGPQEKATIIDRAIFGIEIVPPAPAKKGKRPKWGAALVGATTRLRAPFCGELVEVTHTLRRPDAKQAGEFAALHAGTAGMVRGGDANLEKYAAGYDALHISHENYKGPVPLHHRAVAYVAHMTR